MKMGAELQWRTIATHTSQFIALIRSAKQWSDRDGDTVLQVVSDLNCRSENAATIHSNRGMG